MRRILIALWFVFAVGTGTAPADVVDRVVANVNGEIILFSELQEQINQARTFRNPARGGDDSLNEKTVLDQMIDGKLQIQYAKKQHFEVTEDEIFNAVEEIKKSNGISNDQFLLALKQRGIEMEDFKKNLEKQILVSRVVKAEVDSTIKIYDREIINYYQTHSQDFLSDEVVHAGHILVMCAPNADSSDEKKARDKIQQAMKEIQGGKNFADVAREYSEDPSAENGGDLGTFKRGKLLASFEDKVFALKAGEVSDIFRLETGFHIVKVYEKQSAGVKALADVRSVIEDQVYQMKREQKYKEWMDSLKNGSYIENLY